MRIAILALIFAIGDLAVPAEQDPVLRDRDTAEPLAFDTPFFGQCLDADFFLFLIDTSASMGWQGELDEVSAEIDAALLSLTPEQSFGIIGYPGEVFARVPLPATPANRIAALRFLDRLVPRGGNLTGTQLDVALDLLERAPGKRSALVICSDVGQEDLRSDWRARLGEFESRKGEDFAIHTFAIAPQDLPFLQTLAEHSGGVYERVR